MGILLDTHAFLWWLSGNTKLSALARTTIAEGTSSGIFVSAASVWEIATKHRLGKLPIAQELAADLEAAIVAQGFLGLAVTVRHGQHAGALPGPHADPFDRMLIAQAILDDLTLISNETPFDAYAVKRLW